ncbi:hypothetical protein HYDPIDRAFT_114956 [Hydnomerulius pinastri MD-312]|uniref:Unplaced genomic scaffold scaffold_23, whole genome shotgun sequence n=1 Tax=Hydnomerulius pinastri MD-312 TaxID=994086 RepID=A0A0C9W5S8_9AGAM|nr:hypothetical protein HYDPIDRAFT_114956 [Hydnomerulius pinastri MD-312]
MVSFKSTLFALALAAVASAKCVASERGKGWEFYVFADENCDYSGTYEEFWGSANPIDMICHNISNNMDVHSFAFTSDSHGITMFSGTNCGGSVLGYSDGNWFDDSVSSAGSKMQSFQPVLIK